VTDSQLRRRTATARWAGVNPAPYKEAGSAPFRGIPRQLLFDEADLGCELRYFEIAPGGHSTLERHQHRHAVLVLRGRGRCLVGDRIHEIAEHDPLDPRWDPTRPGRRLEAGVERRLGLRELVELPFELL